ncbi:MAG: ParB/RepB/Spo0J family partition protein [Anaeromyxobacteraceae bacterium]|nr:ParB/RepB/Spo0J family partition protein [Anaeromyxobacteraceae bacterium]
MDDVAAYASEATKDAVLASILPGQQLRAIRVDLISPAPEGQARQHFDEDRLKTLAESLKRSGVREPIIVTPHGAGPGRFQIVAGERRWRAAQLAGLSEIPCIVDPSLEDRRAKLLAQAEENLHREDLNPVEEAAVLAQLMETRGIEVREAGELMGRSYIQARRLHRLHKAIGPIKQAVISGDLDARAAVEVTRIYNTLAQKDMSVELRDTTSRISKLIERVVREKWSARRLEQYATKLGAGASEEDAETPDRSAEAPEPPAVRSKPTLKAGASPAEAKAPVASAPVEEGPAPVVTRADGRVIIAEHRIQRGGLTPEEREEVIAVLEDLLMRARRV